MMVRSAAGKVTSTSLDTCPAIQQALDYYYDQYEDDLKEKQNCRQFTKMKDS